MGILDNFFGRKKVQVKRPEKKESTIKVHKVSRPATVSRGHVYEGRVTSVMPYGIFVDLGTDRGLVHASNLSWQYMNENEIAEQYHEGQIVRVVVLGYDDKGRIQLGIKQLHEFKYAKGDQLEVTIKSYIPGKGMEAVINDELNTKCFIPIGELAWNGDVQPMTLIGKSRTVVAIRINQRDHRITCSLKQIEISPWERPTDLHVGSVIDVKVVKYSDSGLSIVTINEGLPGFIHKNQITWLVADENISEGDCPAIGSEVRVVVKSFDPQNKKLLCSIKEIQEDPWKILKVGQPILGKVIEDHSQYYTVLLQNGIKCKCYDNIELVVANTYQFLIINVDVNGRKATVSKQISDYSLRNAQHIQNFFNRRGVKEHAFIKGNAVLLPEHIMYGEEPVAMPFAMEFLTFLYSHPEKLVKYKELFVVDTPRGKYSFIAIDLQELGYTIPEADKDALRNTEIPIKKVVTETMNGFVVQLAGRFGYVEKDDMPNSSALNGIMVRFVDFGQSLQIDKFATYDRADDKVELSHENHNLFCLTDEEISVLEDREKTLLEAVVLDNPTMEKGNIQRVAEQICVSYDPSNTYLIQLNDLLAKDPDYFTSHDFWLTSKIDDRNGEQKLRVYDANDVMLICRATDSSIYAEKIYCGRQHKEVQREYNANTHALYLPAGNLHLYRLYDAPSTYDAARVRLVLLRQYDIFANLLPNLHERVRKAKRTIGKDYVAMSQYLRYQQNRERQRLEGLEADIDGHHIRIGSMDGSCNVGLIINNPQCEQFFDDESDIQNVKVVRNGEDKSIFATLQRGDHPGEFFLYFKYTPDLDGYKNDGMTITPNANIYHLQIQQRSVNNFVENGGLLTRLERGKIKKPVIDGDIEFFDTKFSKVEEGNNQPLAIRKAVGNQDIFLIQGPPGTGKTSVIVEIIRQLVRKGERVLVCSQAHTAVRNIYDRLTAADKEMNIGFLDDEDTMRPLSLEDHKIFLRHNIELLGELAKGHDTKAEQMCDEYETNYSEYVRKDFTKMHRYLVRYFHESVHDCNDVKNLISNFKEEVEHLVGEQNGFYSAGHICSMQVVMGTCIGIGTDRDLYNSGVHFDTLIVDEAGKANLAETNVPMQLASKYILVGDDNQLPPYMDSEDIDEFEKSDEANSIEEGTNIEEALGMSLFEYFLRHEQFPAENQVLLNYQYRMNPILGDKISALFYGNKLYNGRGTENQSCDMPGFPEAVTFIDTGLTRNVKQYNPYENNSGEGSIYNPCEIDIICKDLVPKLESMRLTDSSISIGIIAPYNAQVRHIREALYDMRSPLAKCVYTIDNVQGQEYDVVVVSFVRSFPFEEGRKVGFLDDLRRLNVALSRAKKKLIMVGNLPTLTRPGAHYKLNVKDERKQPVEIFKSISAEASVRHAELNSLDKLAKHGITPGYVFKDCRIIYEGPSSKQRCYFITKVGDENLKFALPSNLGLANNAVCDVKFVALNNRGNDHPTFDVKNPVIISHDDHRGRVRLADGSERDVEFNTSYFLLSTLLHGDLGGVAIPLDFSGSQVSLIGVKLKKEVAAFPHEKGDVIQGRIIAKASKGVYVDCNDALGFIYLNNYLLVSLQLGQVVYCKVRNKNSEKLAVSLTMVNK
ncbi:AAA domain-containing protein [Hallella absiana]|uniref:AAA domain-containing protein n=1 Tax=Hallella absiana TaxID=2925336 RepID=UPI0021C7A0BC|nr:AAA domain-containing protein [Hallella absiana]